MKTLNLKYVNITLLLCLFLLLFISCGKSNDSFGSIDNPDDTDSDNIDIGDDNGNNKNENGDEEDNENHEEPSEDGEHIHQLTEIMGKAPTCTEGGVLTCYKCAVCEKMYLDSNAEIFIEEQTVFLPLGHRLTHHESDLSDCTNGGHKEYYSCILCGSFFLDSNGLNQVDKPPYVEKAEHSLIFVPQTTPSCTSMGYYAYYKCVNCNKMFSDNGANIEIFEPIAFSGVVHRLIKHDAVPSTCTENGYIEYYSCIDCHKSFTTPDAIQELAQIPTLEKSAHDLTEYPSVEPTCSQAGYKNYFVCSECLGIFLDSGAKHPATSPLVIPTVPHTPTFFSAVASTCTENGIEAYYRCTECDGLFSDEACQNPKATINTLPLKPHQVEHYKFTDSTCTVKGVTEHYKCTVCEQLFKNSSATIKINDSVELALKPHVFEDDKCIRCDYKIRIADFYDYIVANINDTITVRGFVTAIGASSNTLYIQYADYAYRIINADVSNIAIGDMVLVTGIKREKITIDCANISRIAPDESTSPTPYNITKLLLNDTDEVLNVKQYTYVSIDDLTLLYSNGNEYVMAYLVFDDSLNVVSEKMIYFTLDKSTPLGTYDASLIKMMFEPLAEATATGLIYQDGDKLCLIPTSCDFLSNVAYPEDIPLYSILKYEMLVYQFDYSTLSEDCVITLSSMPQKYENVKINWTCANENVTIVDMSDYGYYQASIKVAGADLICLVAEFSIDYSAYGPLTITTNYYITIS